MPATEPKSKYYYVKPKAKSKLSFGHVNAKGLDINFVTPSQPAVQRNQIMDLAFVNADALTVTHPMVRPAVSSSTALSFAWLRLLGLAVFGVIIYAGGVALYQSANQIKKDTVGTVNQAVAKLEAAAQAISANDLPAAKLDLANSEKLFSSAQKDILSLGQTNLYMSGLANEHFQIIAGQKLIDAGLNLAQGGQLLIATAEPALKYFNNTTVAQGNTQTQDFLSQVIQMFSASSRNLDKALIKVAKANSLLQSIQPDSLGSSYEAVLKVAQGKASTMYEAVAMIDTLSRQLPRALGEPNPRSYLIMNQNDTELRPTGGFMGSYAIVKLHHGKITDFYTDDAYRIDGQLVGPDSKEKVIPNANFDPNFSTTAKYVANLYEQAGGGTPDGVIAINTQVMSAVMQVIGNIELPNRKLTITPSNFAQVIYGEIQKVEKTDNPKVILSELSPILLNKVMSLNREDLNKLTPLLLDQLKQKNIMMYTRQPDLEKLLAKLDWSGDLQMTAPKQDYLMVVRANMGAMKSSYNILDDIKHQVAINSTGDVVEKLTLTYAHIGTGSLPDGPNKDYIRVYVPKGSIARNIIGYDVAEGMVTEPAHDKTYFGFYVTTNPGETKTITVDYQLPFKLDMTKGESYSLYIQKQAGTLNTTLNSTLQVPSDGLSLTNSAKELFRGMLTGDVSI
jgi:hypothetical protein